MRLRRAATLILATLLCAQLLAAQTPGCSADGVATLAGSARADCFIELGRLQEAAWIYQDAGDRGRAHELLAELEAQMRARPTSVRVLSAAGVANLMATYRARFRSGVSGVFKPNYTDIGCMECTAKHERAAFLVDTIMRVGLTPLTIMRELELPDGTVIEGSLMYFVEDSQQSAMFYSPDGQPVETEEHKPDLLRLLDVFLGNGDRHQGNWLVRSTGEIAAIDHNRAFLHDKTTTTTHWRQQYCRIEDLDALDEYVRRFESTSVDDYGPEFVTLLSPARLAAFRAERAEIVRTLTAREPCPLGAPGVPSEAPHP